MPLNWPLEIKMPENNICSSYVVFSIISLIFFGTIMLAEFSVHSVILSLFGMLVTYSLPIIIIVLLVSIVLVAISSIRSKSYRILLFVLSWYGLLALSILFLINPNKPIISFLIAAYSLYRCISYSKSVYAE